MYGGHFTIHDVIVMVNSMTQIDARMRWMYGDRRGSDFIAGLQKFIDLAKANKVYNFMPCPCVDCRNVAKHSSSRTLQSHLLRRGFIPGYYCWAKHEERGVRLEENE